MASRSEKVVSYPRNRGILSGFRNKLINGGFLINQRGLSNVTINPGQTTFVADRWFVFNNTDQPCVVSRFGFNKSDTDKYAAMAQFSVAPTTGYLYIIQRIEDAKTLAGKSATFTCRMAAPTTMTGAAIEFNRKLNSSTTEGSIAVAEIPTFTSNGSFVRNDVIVNIPTIPDAGSALSGDYLEAVIRITPRSSGAFAVARVSLVEGDARGEDDPFAQRHHQQEVALCQRYYWKSKTLNSPGIQVAAANYFSAIELTFPVEMRVTPTLIFSNLNGVSGYVTTRGATGDVISGSVVPEFPSADKGGAAIGMVAPNRAFFNAIVTVDAEL